MRRHTSSTSASDEPALSTMIMPISFVAGPRARRHTVAGLASPAHTVGGLRKALPGSALPASTKNKGRGGRPRPRVVGAAGVRSARGALDVLARSEEHTSELQSHHDL